MVPELSFFTSNRLDRLVERLASTLASRPLPPLEREIVIVQSFGIQRWLTLELARRNGISGGLTTPFPRPFCHWLARRVLDSEAIPSSEEIVDGRERHPFDRHALTWRLFQRLGQVQEEDTQGEASEALAYLSRDPDQRKRFQLASRLAGLFDDYQMFRPDMLLRWEGKEPDRRDSSELPQEAWQAGLWRSLIDEPALDSADAPLHLRLRGLIQALQSESAPAGLPSRVSVLGVSSLPPIFVELLAAVSRHLPVAVYFVSPTCHYWGDLRSERETSRLARRLQLSPDRLLDEQHFQQGHPLLAALGRQGRDFFNLLQQADSTGGAWQELDLVDPGEGSALHVLQHDILHLNERTLDERLAWRDDDVSLEVHSCHSPLREMQVLKDRLLGALAQDPSLRPSDILVQVPDIELYGPYIQAVFGVEHRDEPRLPFSIADRRAGREQPPSEVFLDLFDLVGERLTVRQVFNLLDTAAIRRRFNLGVDDIPMLRSLVDAAQIRWAMDGSQKRRDFELPAWGSNTWRAGLDRLLMGYAVGPGDGNVLSAGIAPLAGQTSGPTEALGRLAAYVEGLFRALRSLGVARSLETWADVALDALDHLFAAETEGEIHGLQWVRDEVGRLASFGAELGFEESVAPRVVRDYLASVLHATGFGSGFIDGRITFCALKPMRTIPFPVVCIAGLNDGAFPRRDQRQSFDLIHADPRPGDRSLRDDDRYLFLETLLAARSRLVLTYVGRSQKDSSAREPSVVLSELLDQLDRTFIGPDGGSARSAIVVDHRLQAWSSAYFDDADLSTGGSLPHSYSQENARAAEALRTARSSLPRFADRPLPALDDALLDQHGPFDLEIQVADLQRFWQQPSRYWCEKGLGVSLEAETSTEPDSEPFVVAGLQAFDLRQWMMEKRLEDRRAEDAGEKIDEEAEDGPDLQEIEDREIEILRAEGRLPALDMGVHQMRRQSRRVEDFLDRLPPLRPAPPQPVDLHFHDDELGVRVMGLLQHGVLDEPGQVNRIVYFRCGQVRPSDRLRAWIELLLAAVQARQLGKPTPSAWLVGEQTSVELKAPIDAETRLEELIQGYRRGLGRPLAFFPQASYAFAEQKAKVDDPRSAARITPLEKARQVFEGRETPRRGPSAAPERPTPDAEDPYCRLAFRGVDPIEEMDFARWAMLIWQPILAHSREQER